jgi:hypothetical protein
MVIGLAGEHDSSKLRFGFLGELACRVGGNVSGTVVLEANLEGARGQLADPHGVRTLRPVTCSPYAGNGVSPLSYPQAELARIWHDALPSGEP